MAILIFVILVIIFFAVLALSIMYVVVSKSNSITLRELAAASRLGKFDEVIDFEELSKKYDEAVSKLLTTEEYEEAYKYYAVAKLYYLMILGSRKDPKSLGDAFLYFDALERSLISKFLPNKYWHIPAYLLKNNSK